MTETAYMVILGAGGFARELAWLWMEAFRADPQLPRLIGFIAEEADFDSWQGIPVLGNDAWARNQLPAGTGFSVGIGFPGIRKKLAEAYESISFQPITLIHPSVHIGLGSQIGEGSAICAGTIVAIDAAIGRHVLSNLHVNIGHDCQVGDYSVLSPGARMSGYSELGEAGEIGTNAVLLPGVKLGNRVRLGAGGVATKDLPLAGTYVGIPARLIGG